MTISLNFFKSACQHRFPANHPTVCLRIPVKIRVEEQRQQIPGLTYIARDKTRAFPRFFVLIVRPSFKLQQLVKNELIEGSAFFYKCIIVELFDTHFWAAFKDRNTHLNHLLNEDVLHSNGVTRASASPAQRRCGLTPVLQSVATIRRCFSLCPRQRRSLGNLGRNRGNPNQVNNEEINKNINKVRFQAKPKDCKDFERGTP